MITAWLVLMAIACFAVFAACGPLGGVLFLVAAVFIAVDVLRKRRVARQAQQRLAAQMSRLVEDMVDYGLITR